MKKTTVHTRKGRALRWLGGAAGLLVLMSLVGLYTPLPFLTVDRQAQAKGLENLRIVERAWSPQEWDTIHYLGDGTDSLLFTTAYWSLDSGWIPSHSTMELSKEDPQRQFALRSVYYKEEGVYQIRLLGFLPFGETAPTLYCGPVADAQYLGKEPFPNSNIAFIGEPVAVTPSADIPVEGGRCFWEELTLPWTEEDMEVPLVLYAVKDETGAYTLLENWSFSSRW